MVGEASGVGDLSVDLSRHVVEHDEGQIGPVDAEVRWAALDARTHPSPVVEFEEDVAVGTAVPVSPGSLWLLFLDRC